jgi:hypothetical protein
VSTDEYIIIMSIGSTAATLNALTDWTELLDENAAIGLKILRYTGAGVPSNPTFTSSATTRSAWVAFLITGANKSITPQIGTTATGTGTTPDPPAITPTGGVAKDYLSIAFCGSAGEQADDDTYVTTFPTNYTLYQAEKTCGTAGTNLGGLIGTASREINSGASIDPGTFTVSETGNWRAQHILVHPLPPPTATSVAKVSLAAGDTPETRTAHSIKARVRKTSGTGTVTFSAALYEGANNRSGNLTTGSLTTSLAEYTLSISDANAINITSYANLDIWFWGDSITADTVNVEVADIWLEIPAAAAPQDIVKDLIPATETDSSQALARTILKTLTVATETGASQALISAKLLSIANATESDAATTLTWFLSKSLTAATESDVSQAVAISKTVTIAPATETDSSQTLSFSLGNPIIKTLTAAVETDTSQALVSTKTIFKTLSAATETDSSQALVAAKAKTISPATRVAWVMQLPLVIPTRRPIAGEIAQPITYFSQIAITIATETDAAQTLSFSKTIFKSLIPAVETDAAQAISTTASKTLAAGTESDTAQSLSYAVSPSHQVTITAAVGTDTAQAITFSKTIFKSLTAATETDSSQALVAIKRVTIGSAVESDIAYDLQIAGGPQHITIQAATEIGTAQSLTVVKTIFKSLVSATETDASQIVAIAKSKTITNSVETGTAQSLTIAKQLAPATEIDEAYALNFGATKILVSATETEIAQTLTSYKLVAISPASEQDSAQTFIYTKPVSLGPASEFDIAPQLTLVGTSYFDITFATEIDVAVKIHLIRRSNYPRNYSGSLARPNVGYISGVQSGYVERPKVGKVK